MTVVLATSFALVCLCVGVHYEALSLATPLIRRLHVAHRFRVVVGLIAAMAAHIIEILFFAAAWSYLAYMGEPTLSIPDPSSVDVIYFSFSSYTSLGYGDIVALGDSRLMAGLEGLVGLVLIAWTASFTYFEMRVYWDEAHPTGPDSRLGPLG